MMGSQKIEPTENVIAARKWLHEERRARLLAVRGAPVKWPDTGIPPTRETLRKLRADVILRLVGQGRLNRQQADAAAEIHAVWSAWVSAAFPAKPVSERVDGGRMIATPLDRIPERLQRAWLRNYLPWSRRMETAFGPGTRLEFVLDIVVDNRGLQATERKFGLSVGHGLGIKELRAALDLY